MCYGCWQEYYGSAQIDAPAIRVTAAAIAKVYDYSLSGGRLHIIIDDFNLEDHNLAWTAEYLAANPADSPEQDAAERYCLGLLQGLTVAERASALALYEGFWHIDANPR